MPVPIEKWESIFFGITPRVVFRLPGTTALERGWKSVGRDLIERVFRVSYT